MIDIKNRRKLPVVLVCIALLVFFTVITASLFFRKIQRNLDELSTAVMEDIDLSVIPDGTYEGEAKVFPVSVSLIVTVENNRITAVDITRHVNGKGEEAEAITEEVIIRQSLDVDAISGATYSSKVILMAIKDALKN